MNDEIKSTIIYEGEQAEMGTPAAEKLIEKIVGKIVKPTGGRMEVKISFPVIEIKTKTQKSDAGALVTTVQLETMMKEEDIARLWYLSRQQVPIICDIGSPQAEMDLLIKPIDLKTGEVKEPALAGAKKE